MSLRVWWSPVQLVTFVMLHLRSIVPQTECIGQGAYRYQASFAFFFSLMKKTDEEQERKEDEEEMRKES